MQPAEYNSLPAEIREQFEAEEVTPEQLKDRGIDKLTYFQRRKDNLKPQTKSEPLLRE